MERIWETGWFGLFIGSIRLTVILISSEFVKFIFKVCPFIILSFGSLIVLLILSDLSIVGLAAVETITIVKIIKQPQEKLILFFDLLFLVPFPLFENAITWSTFSVLEECGLFW